MFDTWKNEPDSFVHDGNTVTITAAGGTDYFNDPASDVRKASAPVLYREVDGDFTVEGRVAPAFGATYDAGAIVFYCTDDVWAKLAFEQTDLGSTSVVTVVTNGLSDDANGEVVDGDAVHLKMSRRGDVLGLYYSLDGRGWRMVRLLALPVPPGATANVGISAQSPTGSGCTVTFSELAFAKRAVTEMRGGV